MNRIKTQKWLKQRHIILEECFASVLRRYVENYKKEHGMLRLDEVYRLMGTSRQNVAFWEKNPCSTHTKKTKVSDCA